MKITSSSKLKHRKLVAPKRKRSPAPAATRVATKAKAVKPAAAKSKRASQPLPAPEITSEQIARRAYFIWEQQGKPAGKEAEHWLLAEQQIKAEQSFTE